MSSVLTDLQEVGLILTSSSGRNKRMAVLTERTTSLKPSLTRTLAEESVVAVVVCPQGFNKWCHVGR